MHCNDVKEYLLDYMDNELPASHMLDIDQHLRTCQACRECYDGYRKTQLVLQLRAVPEPPEEYWDEAWQKIRERSQASILSLNAAGGSKRSPIHKSVWWRYLAAAVVIFAISAGIALFDNDQSVPVAEPDIAQVIESTDRPPLEIDERLTDDLQRQMELINISRATNGSIDPISKGALFVKLEYPSQ